MRLRRLLAACGAIVLLGCASGGELAARAADETKLGVRMAQRGYWQEAFFRFSRALELDPDNSEILNNLAVSQEALGRFDDALVTYKKALQGASKRSPVRGNYAHFAEFFTSYARGVKPKGGASANP